MEFLYRAVSIRETDRLGEALAEVVPDRLTIGLSGTLGAGKTRLVQSLAQAVGVPPETVVSPTFVLCQHYRAARAIHHIDAYRLRDDDEFLQLGPEEYFDAPAITVIEWADRVEACLPPDRLMIEIEITGEEARQFRIQPRGKVAQESLERLREVLSRP